jgi:imidazolonepropionase-like amidohydrolase
VSKWPKLTPETAEEFVKRNKEQGADYIKLMQENGHSVGFPKVVAASLELQKAVTSAAHRHGLLVVAHATNMEETMMVLRAGVDGLTHTFADQWPSSELIQLYQQTGAFVVPTLVVLASLTGEERGTSARFASGDGETRAIMCDALNHHGPGVKMENAYASVRQLKAAGIDIVAGTDAVPGVKGTALGPSLLEELYLYVERCGFPPAEALKSATSVAARRFRLEDRGRIEAGRRADLLMVRGDPTHDIEDLRHIEGVWKAGVRCV